MEPNKGYQDKPPAAAAKAVAQGVNWSSDSESSQEILAQHYANFVPFDTVLSSARSTAAWPPRVECGPEEEEECSKNDVNYSGDAVSGRGC